MPRQDQDDEAFLSYFDFDTQTAFAWNGDSNTVDVMEKGPGEKVTATFEINEIADVGANNGMSFTVAQWRKHFVSSCKYYMKQLEKEMPVIDADFK